jgi:hypothetical protein
VARARHWFPERRREEEGVAKLQVEGDELVVTMHTTEELGAFHGPVRVPLAAVQSVRSVDDPWAELRGLRAPGTGIPGVIALGTLRGTFGKDFVAVYHHRPGVVVELQGAEFSRLVVTADDAVEVAAHVAAAVPGCGPAGGAAPGQPVG